MCRLPAPVVLSLPVLLLYLAVTEPLLALAPVPSTTALQLGPLSVAWMRVMVPVVTPPEKDLAFSFQGKCVVCTLKVSPSGPVQLLKPSAVIDAMPAPDSPLPFLAEPLPLEDVQVSFDPVFLSVSVVFPALAVMAPPGLTVQVVAALALVPAIALPAPRPRTPASAAPMTRTLPARL